MSAQLTEPFGLHLTLDAYGGSKTRLYDMKRVFKVLNELPGILDMKKLTTPYVVDAPPVTPKDQGGISGFVMIAESHVSIHTFPDKGFLTADIYSCKAFDTQKALNFFKKHFELQEMEVNIIKRGLKFPMPKQDFVPTPAPAPQVSFQ
ncbi:S-adenosylmethionine decarboxylase proenzyme [Candidatus Curtissbacteria bacterium RIFCSPHIGHO2_01_FULL_41_11]|uniref:S-adenosylmethionine decarboxylase proenzyme n=1 Tax=Candidatus Curtissbacteria bacterium RIFCSPHIGHO2_01_FULL_41_11 TaxID=1797711 RepID=A0A1F5G896_9BACT|nr:MAG: S-adenosylmethionine decarboxylase proenzyme [Candidatus Curtissbacteria bacterium RIFCSPHIGHO2_01_FULL_41_11]